jgi:hypothetical protein
VPPPTTLLCAPPHNIIAKVIEKYGECYHPGCDIVLSDRILTFQRSIPSPSLGGKSKPSKQSELHVENVVQMWVGAQREPIGAWRSVKESEDGGSMCL